MLSSVYYDIVVCLFVCLFQFLKEIMNVPEHEELHFQCGSVSLPGFSSKERDKRGH